MDAQGFVLPKVIGGDISCGMRLVSTNITKDEFDSIPKLLIIN
jgi:RNA-splicing ligase RtcB